LRPPRSERRAVQATSRSAPGCSSDERQAPGCFEALTSTGSARTATNPFHTVTSAPPTVAITAQPATRLGRDIPDADTCPDTPKGATVDAHGCLHDTDGDAVLDGIDRCPDSRRAPPSTRSAARTTRRRQRSRLARCVPPVAGVGRPAARAIDGTASLTASTALTRFAAPPSTPGLSASTDAARCPRRHRRCRHDCRGLQALPLTGCGRVHGAETEMPDIGMIRLQNELHDRGGHAAPNRTCRPIWLAAVSPAAEPGSRWWAHRLRGRRRQNQKERADAVLDYRCRSIRN
jgi:hypothetical protein